MLLAIGLGLIFTGLDVFAMASWPAGFRISFITLGFLFFLAQNRPRPALALLLSGALAADLAAPLGFWGARLIGYTFFYVLARLLISSFFPQNRRGALLALTFVLSLTMQAGAFFFYHFIDWWVGKEAGGLLASRSGLDFLQASALAVAIMWFGMYIGGRLRRLGQRFFLVRH